MKERYTWQFDQNSPLQGLGGRRGAGGTQVTSSPAQSLLSANCPAIIVLHCYQLFHQSKIAIAKYFTNLSLLLISTSWFNHPIARSPVSLDNGYRPTAQSQKSNHDYDHNSNHNHIYNHEQPHLNQQWQTRGSLQLEPSTFSLKTTSSSSKTRAANIERSGHTDDSTTSTSWPPQLLLRRQRSV